MVVHFYRYPLRKHHILTTWCRPASAFLFHVSIRQEHFSSTHLLMTVKVNARTFECKLVWRPIVSIMGFIVVTFITVGIIALTPAMCTCRTALWHSLGCIEASNPDSAKWIGVGTEMLSHLKSAVLKLGVCILYSYAFFIFGSFRLKLISEEHEYSCWPSWQSKVFQMSSIICTYLQNRLSLHRTSSWNFSCCYTNVSW